ncbi:MAG TPA: hypothetical protein VMD06_12715 [Steroidobacteraceae bacterium]|nr:hypothetical protein [Steroidobacteraceae bacterium]
MSTEAWYTPLLNSIPSGLIGAAVVYYFGLRQRAKERRFSFLERQLAEFYAPLAGVYKQIRTKSELRAKIQGLFPDDDLSQIKAFEATIDYHNRQFEEEILPKYREMLALFTERYHLADAATRAFYPLFLEFVEGWNIGLARVLSADVLRQLDVSEEKVKPFYQHLEKKMQQLQDEIASG